MSLPPTSAVPHGASLPQRNQPPAQIPPQGLQFVSAPGALQGDLGQASGTVAHTVAEQGGRAALSHPLLGTLPPALQNLAHCGQGGGVASQGGGDASGGGGGGGGGAGAQSLQGSGSNPNLAGSSEATSNRSNPTSTQAASASASAPCGACKFLRRKCTPTCVFASHFQPDQSPKFAHVHKIFGASNVAKWLQELPAQSRDDAVNSLCYEADARIKDPVYGCVGALFALQQQVVRLQAESAAAQAELARLRAIAAGQVGKGAIPFPSSNVGSEQMPSRLPSPAHHMAMMPAFMSPNVPSPAALLMNTISGFEHGVQPANITIPMYNIKPGSGLGAGMLAQTPAHSTHMALYSMPSGSHTHSQNFTSPTHAAQGMPSVPPPLKLSPQSMGMGNLHGVPSTGSTNELGAALVDESPSAHGLPHGVSRSKRHRSEQGSSASGSGFGTSPPASHRPQSFAENVFLQGMPQGCYPVLEAVTSRTFQEHDLSRPVIGQGQPGNQDVAQVAMFQQMQQHNLSASMGLRH